MHERWWREFQQSVVVRARQNPAAVKPKDSEIAVVDEMPLCRRSRGNYLSHVESKDSRATSDLDGWRGMLETAQSSGPRFVPLLQAVS